MDRTPSNHQSNDERGEQFTQNSNTYRSTEGTPVDNRKAYDQTSSSYRRHASGPNGNANGVSNRYTHGATSPPPPQHHMQFTPSNQPASYYDNHPRYRSYEGNRKPRNNHRSNWQSNQYSHGGHHQPQPVNSAPNYNHANYDMWTGYPDQYATHSSSRSDSPGQPSSPSSQAQGSGGANSPKHQSPGRGPRVTINPHPTIHPIPQSRPKPTNYKSKLEMLCLKNNLQVPQYTAIAAKETKYRSSDFYCNLTIGDEKWKTSPKFYATKEEAEQMVAKKAFNDLSTRHRATATPEECIEMDTLQLVDRVKKLLSKSKSGYFSAGVEEEYKKKYRTELPNNWIETLTSNCDEVKIEVTQVTNKTLTLLIYNKMTIPHFELSKEDSEEEWLFAMVRSVHSPSSFWLHLLKEDESLPDQLTRLSEEMKQYYESTDSSAINLPVDKISKGKFAALQHTAGWARFQVKEIIKAQSEVPRTDVSETTVPTNTEETTIENGKNSEEENICVTGDKEITSETASAGAAKDSNESVTDDRSDGTTDTLEHSRKDAPSAEEGCASGERESDTSQPKTSDERHEVDSDSRADTNEPSTVTVRGYLVDFGIQIDIPSSSLKVLEDKFYELPRQAVECSLGLKPSTGRVWSDTAKEYFSSLTLNKPLCMKIVDKNRMIIELVDTRTDSSPNIGEQLIANNHATKSAPKSEQTSPNSGVTSPKSELTSPESESLAQQSEQSAPENEAAAASESTQETCPPKDDTSTKEESTSNSEWTQPENQQPSWE